MSATTHTAGRFVGQSVKRRAQAQSAGSQSPGRDVSAGTPAIGAA